MTAQTRSTSLVLLNPTSAALPAAPAPVPAGAAAPLPATSRTLAYSAAGFLDFAFVALSVPLDIPVEIALEIALAQASLEEIAIAQMTGKP